MSDSGKQETLSALVDSEASELECRRLLRDLDDADAGTWARWHLARDLMHDHASVVPPEDFASRICEDLPSRSRRPLSWAGGARALVAASVAAATVVGWQFWNAAPMADAGEPVARVAEVPEMVTKGAWPSAEAASVAVQVGASQAHANTNTASSASYVGFENFGVSERHLKRLIMRHNDLVARHARQGITANARLVSLELTNEH